MIITLTGGNTFLLRRRLSELVEKFVEKHGDLAVERIDAEQVEATRIIESIQALPFLTAHKMVVVRSGNLNKQFAEQIEQVISSVHGTTDLIFYEPVIDKRTSYFKMLKGKTKLEEFNELDNSQLAKWLIDEAKQQGGSLQSVDAHYLIERVGANQELLANELTKLLTYDPQISRNSIQLLTEATPQSRIFDLLDASFGGDKKRALKLYEEQRAQRVEPQAILSMIAWQLHLITLAKVGKGRSSRQIAQDSGVNPFPLQKAINLADKLSNEKVRQLVDEAFKIDWQSKTTNLDLDEALKTYIVTI